MTELLPIVLLHLKKSVNFCDWKRIHRLFPICLCLWWKRKKQKTQKQKKQKEKDNNKNNKKVLFCVFVSWVFCFWAVWRESNGDDACEEAGTSSSSLLCTWEIEQQSYYRWRSSLQDSEFQCKLVNNPKTPPTQQPDLCIRLTVRDQNYHCKWKLQLQIRMPTSLLFVTNTDRFHTYICQEIWRSLLWWWCCFARGILDGSIVIYEYIFLHDLLDWWSVQKDSEMFSKPDQWKLGSRIFLGFTQEFVVLGISSFLLDPREFAEHWL